MGNDSVEVVRPEAAVLAPDVPIRLVHEVIYDELAAAAKEVRQSLSAVLAFEYVLLLNALPGQLAPLPAELFAQAPAGGAPVVVTYDLLVGHGIQRQRAPVPWWVYSSWRRHQTPISLRPLGVRSSHWYMPQRPSSPRA